MSIQMRRPETVRLDLGDGDWLLVKKHLTAGERREIHKGMVDENGHRQILAYAPAMVSTYLVDWSGKDADGNHIPIQDLPREHVLSILDNLPTEAFDQIRDAIDAHVAALDKQLEKEKNGKGGGKKSSAISPSARSSAGVTATSKSSPITSTSSSLTN